MVKRDDSGNYGYVIEDNDVLNFSPEKINLTSKIEGLNQIFHEVFKEDPYRIGKFKEKKQRDGEDKSSCKRYFFISSINKMFSKHVPLVGAGGEISFLDISIIHEWETEKQGILEKVALLRKTDGETFWKVTVGRDQTIYGCLKFLCIFPRANERPLREELPPIRWPLVIKEADPDFLKNHDLKEIDHTFRSRVSSIEFVKKLVFTRKYQTAKSKLDPSISVSPYEFGVTLIGIGYGMNISIPWESTRECSQRGSLARPGHLAIIVESVKNGTYYAEIIDVRFFEDWEKPIKSAGCVYIGEPGRKTSDGGFDFLKDVASVTDIFPDLTHSKTWIRTKEDIEKMKAHVQEQIDRQSPRNPVVLLNFVGKDAFISPIRGVRGALTKDERDHSCVTWAIDTLELAGISVDTGIFTKYFASLPKSYSRSDTEAASDAGIAWSKRFLTTNQDVFLDTLRSKKRKAEDLLSNFFIYKQHSLFYRTRPNSFIAQGQVSEKDTLQFLVGFFRESEVAANKGLSNFSEIFRQTCKFLAENHSGEGFKTRERGLTFNQTGFQKMIKPVGIRIFQTGLLMKRFVGEFGNRNSSLKIMEADKWEEKEEGRHFPKSYRQTVQEILSLCLTAEICEEGLSFSGYSDKNESIYI